MQKENYTYITDLFFRRHKKVAQTLLWTSNNVFLHVLKAVSDRIWYKNEYGTNLYHIRPNMVQLSNCTIYVSAVLG